MIVFKKSIQNISRQIVSSCAFPYRRFFSHKLSNRFFSSTFESVRAVTHFTDDQNMLRESVRGFANDEIGPLVRKMDEEQQIDSELLEKLFKQGYMGVDVSLDEGGCGMTFIDCLIVVEEIARVDPSIAVIVDVHNTLVNRCFKMYGTTEQKTLYLPKCAQEMVGSFCLSESESGSDAFALKTRAVKCNQRNGWIINGAKQWISNAKEAGVFIVFATVDPEKKYKGITAFIVDCTSNGLEVGKKIEKLGIRASSTCEVFFNDVFVPDDMVLGNVGEGYKIAIDGLNDGRIGIAAQMIGLANGAFNYTLEYLHRRKQFGNFLANFQGIKFQYAKLATEIEAARVLTYNAASLRAQKLPFTKEAAMAKLYASITAEKVASECVGLLGGNGFSSEFPIEKFYRDAKIGTIYEGTSNIQMETIAKCIQKDYISN